MFFPQHQPKSLTTAAEVAPVPAWEQQPADAPDTSRVTLGAPVRDSLTWSAARETAVEPRRSVQPDDVMTLVKRLASKKPAQPQKVQRIALGKSVKSRSSSVFGVAH